MLPNDLVKQIFPNPILSLYTISRLKFKISDDIQENN